MFPLNSDNKNCDVLRVMNIVLALHLIWSVCRYLVSVPEIWNGIGIFFFPVLEILLIIYCYIRTQYRLILPYVLLPLVFNIYMIIRHCFSGDFMSHGASDCYTFFFCLFCLISIEDKDFIERFYIFSLTAFWLSISISILSYLSLIVPIVENPFYGGRLQGVLNNPNILGHVVTYGYIFGLGAFLIKPEKKLLWVALLLDTFITIKILLDTECRTAMIFLGLVILGLIISYFTWFRKRLPRNVSQLLLWLIVIILTAFVLFCFLFVISGSVRSFTLDILRVNYDENSSFGDIIKSLWSSFSSASGRDVLRRTAIQHWQENLLFGLSVQTVFADYLGENNRPLDSHNTFLQIGSTLGIVGLVLYLLMYISSFIFSVVSIIKSDDYRMKALSIFETIFFIALTFDICFENFLYMSLTLMTLSGYFIISSGLQLGRFLFCKNNLSRIR